MLAYSFIVTLILGFLLEKTIGFRVSKEQELEGVDVAQHLESAYDFEGDLGGGFAGGRLRQAQGRRQSDEEVPA